MHARILSILTLLSLLSVVHWCMSNSLALPEAAQLSEFVDHLMRARPDLQATSRAHIEEEVCRWSRQDEQTGRSLLHYHCHCLVYRNM